MNQLTTEGPEFDPEKAEEFVYRNAGDNSIIVSALRMVHYGQLTFEQAMCLAVIELARANDRSSEIIREWMTKAIMPIYIPAEEWEKLKFKTSSQYDRLR